MPTEVLREAIVDALVEFAPDGSRLMVLLGRLGLESPGEVFIEDGLFAYTRVHLDTVKTDQDLIAFAQRVVTQVGSDRVDEMLRTYGVRSAHGQFQQLIFAGLGPKPKIVMVDATQNIIKVTTYRHLWMIYDRPLLSSGLTVQALIDWWRTEHPDLTAGKDDVAVSRLLRLRMFQSLPKTSPPQRRFFSSYYARVDRLHPALGFEQPALLPEVHLHYDPYSQTDPTNDKDLERQRMDFLMLLPDGSRVVIEIDGAQHYSREERLAEGVRKIASPQLYGEMMAADRDLRLSGYELYRFGARELPPEQPDTVEAVVNEFFERLLPAAE
ncbi:hypothetical protein [Streptomyces sp. AB3(2024)]|uniref:hypothetical protein n=1 Tax=Streptomyces sp. AB3(2024) TaxID=3317321 RepID=UPI0035A30E69